MNTADLVDAPKFLDVGNSTADLRVYKIFPPEHYGPKITEGVKEPDCNCDCHTPSKLSEVLDELSYKKNIHIKCSECRCFG